MKLKKFRVTSFRSVDDSGWIDVDEVTALIGTNESGKSNILLPLWKLNPAKDGAILPTADYPRKQYTSIRNAEEKPIFIRAIFSMESDLCEKVSQIAGYTSGSIGDVVIMRRLDERYEIDFPDIPEHKLVEEPALSGPIDNGLREITSMEALKTEQVLKEQLITTLGEARREVSAVTEYDIKIVDLVYGMLASIPLENALRTSTIVPRYNRILDEIKLLKTSLEKPHPRCSKEIRDLILSQMPKFVYYSNYGNLDSEIYLPHVIENLKREGLGQKELAKARTLKVLFEFVDLEPQEILDLGRENHSPGQRPTEAQVEESAEKKKERSILLQSASTRLTELFRQWWKQGDYRFRFEADGDHFRIWVSDDRRPEEVELEGRSTGLQWFLSFYLVFLVESSDSHSGSILLLDEPGHSLHPLAQRDLSEFFDGLAEKNQLLYTTHSPFLVDADRLDRARKVYVAADGTSKATSNLGAEDGDLTKRGAGYAVHAALGLSIAESLLIGCKPIVVEGPSDQHYLTCIKTLLAADRSIAVDKELIFPPAGGAKGIKAVVSMLGGRNEDLPTVLLDDDEQGRKFGQVLKNELYTDLPHRVLNTATYTSLENSEVEDLIPSEVIVESLDRIFRQSEQPFADAWKPGSAIVPQIEAWAKMNKVVLEKGWKVELAKRAKKTLLAKGLAVIPQDRKEAWSRLFEDFQQTEDRG